MYSQLPFFNQRVTQRTVPWLEFFHPYKHVCQMLWKFSFYFYSLFAPLVHYLHPTATVSLKPNLKQIECYFTLLRLVYPQIRDELQAAIDSAPRKNRNALVNLQLLFEFFLPIVSVLSLVSHFWMFLDSRLRARCSHGPSQCDLEPLSLHLCYFRCFAFERVYQSVRISNSLLDVFAVY